MQPVVAAVAGEERVGLVCCMRSDQKVGQDSWPLSATFQIAHPAPRGKEAALRIKRLDPDAQVIQEPVTFPTCVKRGANFGVDNVADDDNAAEPRGS